MKIILVIEEKELELKKPCKSCKIFYNDSGVIRCRKCNKEASQEIADNIHKQEQRIIFKK